MAMELDRKNKVKSDLESFLRAKRYYHRLGRVWQKSFLLYGTSGTGKSSFVAAIVNFLSYDIDLCQIPSDSDLKLLLLKTMPSWAIKSVITALQANGDGRRCGLIRRKTEDDLMDEPYGVVCDEDLHKLRICGNCTILGGKLFLFIAELDTTFVHWMQHWN
ncbi:hypothetical protein JHK85_010838 [Glycine max]|nr:hypothetical protein JHK85_010838 [Glycine max]KAG5066815.1 hypothetical protein JHK86_010546 [Glycine max]